MIVTFAFIVACIVGFAAIPWSSAMSPRGNEKLGFVVGTLGFGVGSISLFCIAPAAEQWSTHNWLQDVRTGTTWSLGQVSPDAMDRIYRATSTGVEMVVADTVISRGCPLYWHRGTHVRPRFGNGEPFRVEVVGRATAPDFRYMVKARGEGLDPHCSDRFLITASDLAYVKEDWKLALSAAKEAVPDVHLLAEVLSVRPVR